MATSKRMKALEAKAEEIGIVELSDAIKHLKNLDTDLPKGVKPCGFDQTVEMAFRLGVEAKHADQVVRGSIVFPNGIGKEQRVIVFTQGPNVEKAEAAGANEVGGRELAEKVSGGWLEFDVAIATPDMMGVVGPLGRVLGPRGLMPSPRAGTVTTDVAGAVQEYKAGKVEFRCDDHGVVHCIVGKMSFDEAKLRENAEALVAKIHALRPTAAKGQYIRSVTLTATMSPGIAVAA